MTRLVDIAQKVRSKNAGPFWLTIDIFCGSQSAFDQLCGTLTTAQVAAFLQTDSQTLKRFDLPDLHVIKFSLPRPAIQGTTADRDMHGAALGALLAEFELHG